MPEYLVTDRATLPKYAKIAPNGRSLTWTTQAEASGFATPELAREAFDATCRILWDAASAKMAKAREDGTLESRPDGSYHTFGDRGVYHNPRLLFGPHWLAEGWSPDTGSTHFGSAFAIASRPAKDDLLGVFEQYYLRSAHGWLCRPQAKNREGRLEWNPAFGLAVAFSSLDAAQAQLGHGSAWIVKTSCVFTDVLPSVAPPDPDDTARSIASACEARDIRASLDESVKLRLEALAESAAPKRPASRL
jgi:hypothetical protein